MATTPTPMGQLSPMLQFVQDVYTFGTQLATELGVSGFQYRFASVPYIPHSEGLNLCELVCDIKHVHFELLFHKNEQDGTVSVVCNSSIYNEETDTSTGFPYQNLDDVAGIVERLNDAAME